MSILRTNEEADAVELLKLVIETSDYYQAMAEVVEDQHVGGELSTIAKARAEFKQPCEDAVKELGELPASPDPDKELMQKVGGELTNIVAEDSNQAIVDKCLKEDAKLDNLIEQTELARTSSNWRQLLDSLSEHLAQTKDRIQRLTDS